MTKTIALLLASGLAICTAPAAAQRQFEPAEMLARADADGDGRITRAENRAMRERAFARIDRDGDGFVSSDDVPRRRLANRGGGERLQQLVAGLDVDGDRRVSRGEFVGGPSLAFDRADTDRDGVVDRAELASFREAADRLRSR